MERIIACSDQQKKANRPKTNPTQEQHLVTTI